jgi:hypothetical protein
MSGSLFVVGFFMGMFAVILVGVFDGLFGEKLLFTLVTLGGVAYLSTVAIGGVEQAAESTLPLVWYAGLVVGSLFGGPVALDLHKKIQYGGTPWVVYHVRRLQDA